MKITKASIIYALICNLIVSMMLTLTASLVASNYINPPIFFINLAVGYSVATLIGIFFPLVNIGKKFTMFFNVKADNFKGNRPYRFLAVFAITMVYFIFVSPISTVLNYFLFPSMSEMDAILSFAKNALPLLSVGYISSLIADYFTYMFVHHLDPSF